jgi:hypothetical protein
MAITLSGDGISSDAIASLAASKLTGQVPDANAPAGSVIQALGAIFTGTQTLNGSTWTDITNLSITITPKDANSKFLLLATVNGVADDDGGFFRFSGGNSSNAVGDAAGNRFRSFGHAGYKYNSISLFTLPMTYIDSPATTSAITYKVQFASDNDATYINRTTADSDSSYHARTACTFQVLEIAG